jgi:A/G-specific adenine glycosylase
MLAPVPADTLVDPDPAFTRAVLAWYGLRGRSLPIRVTRDPYAVLVSEVMAQQTQIDRVAVAWAAFLERYPTIEALAGATPADVLRAWKGLGYNRRALNLWRTARTVMDEHGGHLPRDVDELERLPGVGPYSARAIAAIAFGVPVAAVDTNVRRVLGRVVAGAGTVIDPRSMQPTADRLVPAGRPGDWAHALMDLGATVCLPARPRCTECPVQRWCRFAAEGARDELPARATARQRRLPAQVPFPASTRWLRGRLLDRLREAPDGAWTELDGPLGSHSSVAVRRALASLAREYLVEVAEGSATLARLPQRDGRTARRASS